MEIDVAKLVGATKREVRQVEREGKPAKVIVATRTYDTTPEDLWDALTNKERIPRWFLPIEGELTVGGRYQFKGNAGGQVLSCDPPKQFAVTWEMQGSPSWVTVTLAAVATGGTRLELEHVAHVPEEFWKLYGPGAVGVGWELGLMGLQEHVRTRAAVDPVEGAGWATTADGKRFVRECSDGWGRASIAGGTDAAEATAAAIGTTAFYTGEPPAPAAS